MHPSTTSTFFRITLSWERQGNNESLSTSARLWEKYYTTFQLLFSHDADLINRVLCTKSSTLYTACAFGILVVAELLLELGMDVRDLYRTDNSGLSYWSSLITSGSLLSAVRLKEANDDNYRLVTQGRLVRESESFIQACG